MNIMQEKQHHNKKVPLAALNWDEKMSKNDWAQTNTSKNTKTSCNTCDLTRWVWQEYEKYAEYSEYAKYAEYDQVGLAALDQRRQLHVLGRGSSCHGGELQGLCSHVN